MCKISDICLTSILVQADGREVSLGLIYPCLCGSMMLGSAVFPWFFHGTFVLRIEEYLIYIFTVMGFALSIVAYDYQVEKLVAHSSYCCEIIPFIFLL